VLIFERKIFRRIYGPKYENREWKNLKNRELEEMSKGESIVKWINPLAPELFSFNFSTVCGKM